MFKRPVIVYCIILILSIWGIIAIIDKYISISKTNLCNSKVKCPKKVTTFPTMHYIFCNADWAKLFRVHNGIQNALWDSSVSSSHNLVNIDYMDDMFS